MSSSITPTICARGRLRWLLGNGACFRISARGVASDAVSRDYFSRRDDALAFIASDAAAAASYYYALSRSAWAIIRRPSPMPGRPASSPTPRDTRSASRCFLHARINARQYARCEMRHFRMRYAESRALYGMKADFQELHAARHDAATDALATNGAPLPQGTAQPREVPRHHGLDGLYSFSLAD